MRAYDLKSPPGARKSSKRVGRGNGSGHGTYATKGAKGQKARAGHKPGRHFEGGQTRLVKRLPEQRGFTNIFKIEFAVVNLARLEKAFDNNAEVTAEALVAAGIIPNLRFPVKVLGDGDLSKALTVRADKFSASAKEKIAAAGGTAQDIIRG